MEQDRRGERRAEELCRRRQHALRRRRPRHGADRQAHHRAAAERGGREAARSAFAVHGLCAGGQHQGGRNPGDDRRERQDDPMLGLPRTRLQRHRQCAGHRRALADLHLSPAQRHPERHAPRQRSRAHAARGRQTHSGRHDRTRRLHGLPDAVERARPRHRRTTPKADHTSHSWGGRSGVAAQRRSRIGWGAARSVALVDVAACGRYSHASVNIREESMRKLLLLSVIAFLPAAALGADSALQYAYPVAPQGLPQPDPTKTFTAKGSKTGMKLTMREINNQFGPPDWFPDEHPAMPAMVKNGRAPHVRACMLCHLPHGNGHPESASVSGLTADYIIEQMHEFRDGNRMNNRAPVMIEMAKDITEQELKEAADYFASIKPEQQKWIKVVEGKAPKNHVGPGGMRFKDEEALTVNVPSTMIYEVAEDGEGAELRDQH